MDKIFTVPSIIRTLLKQWIAFAAIIVIATGGLIVYIIFFAVPYNKCETSFELVFKYNDGSEADISVEKRDLDNISKRLHGLEMIRMVEYELKTLSYTAIENKDYGYSYNNEGIYTFWCALSIETDAERIAKAYLEFVNIKVYGELSTMFSNKAPELKMINEPHVLEGSKNKDILTRAALFYGIAVFSYIVYCGIIYLFRPFFNSIEEFAHNINVNLLGSTYNFNDTASKFVASTVGKNIIAGYIGVSSKTSVKANGFAAELRRKGFKVLLADLDAASSEGARQTEGKTEKSLKNLIKTKDGLDVIEYADLNSIIEINLSNYNKIIELFRNSASEYDYIIVNFTPASESKDYLTAVKDFDCCVLQTDITNDYSKKIIEVKSELDWIKAKICGIILDSKINSKVFLSGAKYKETI